MNLFLDTQVFELNNFNFDSRRFSSLRKCKEQNLINIYITRIVYEEVKQRIIKRINNSKTALKKINADTRILNNITEFYTAANKNAFSGHIDTLTKRFDEYISQLEIEIIEFQDMDLSQIFGSYFRSDLPFNKELKKNEFPDAVSLMITHNWCNEKELEAVIISGDNDIPDLVESLKLDKISCLENLDHILNELLPNAQLKEYLSEYPNKINEKIESIFSDFSIEVYSQDGDVYDQSLQDVSTNEISIIDVTDDIIMISAEIKLNYTFIYVYNDPDGYFWDSETKESVFVGEKLEETIEVTDMTKIDIECEKLETDGSEWSFFIIDPQLNIDIDYYLE